MLALTPSAPEVGAEILHAPLPSAFKADADSLIKKGVELRKKRKDAEALDLFQRAYSAEPTPRALAQIALAEQALASWIDADTHLRNALSEGADPWIKSNREPLKKALAQIREHLSTINIRGLPEGASVKIGDRPLRTAPVTEGVRVVCEGLISVEASAPGYISQSKSIAPTCGKEESLELNLEKERALELVEKKDPPPPPPLVIRTPVEQSSGGSLSTFGYVAAGGAVLGLGTGVAALIVREGHAKKYNDDAMCLPPNGMTRDQNCSDERRAANSAQFFSIIGFAGGAALGGAAVALFLLDEDEPKSAFACGPTLGGAGLACAGVFE